MFDDFKSAKIKSNKININYKIGGKGYPILMLHGYPQTHIMWRKVAPILSKDYTVVCSDLLSESIITVPFLPTFLKASPIIDPSSLSLFDDIVAT